MSKSPAGQHLKTLAGSTAVVIKGESQQEYDQGREATIRDLGAQSPLEVYLAEKMFDCLWWIRRLDVMRVDVIRQGMFEALRHDFRRANIRRLIEQEAWDDPDLALALNNSGLTVNGLPAAGMVKSQKALESVDRQTALRMKMFRDLQKAYEAHTNRQLNTDRLTLQNRLLSQHLSVKDISSDD
jgi:hypothetical protein